jgi:hypothetical protein
MLTSAIVVMGMERVFCQVGECDMELVGYIFSSPFSLVAYSLVFSVICYGPSLSVKVKLNSIGAVCVVPITIALGFAVLILCIGDNNPWLIVLMLFLFPLLLGNFVGLVLCPSLFSHFAKGHAKDV